MVVESPRTVADVARPSAGGAHSVPAAYFEQGRRYGDREYVRYPTADGWSSLSWAGFVGGARRIAAALVASGVAPGERVALFAENRVEWLLCDLGIQAAGAVTVPVYPSLTADTVHEILRDSGAVACLASRELAGKAGAWLRVETLEDGVRHWLDGQPDDSQLEEVDRRVAAVTADDLATIVYTSGTTGRPKGVMLSNGNLLAAVSASLQAFDIGPSDTVLSYLPYSHVLERVDGILVPSLAGATVCIAHGMDAAVLAVDIGVCRPTIMLGVPRVFEKVHQAVVEGVHKAPGLQQALFRWATGVATRRLHGERGAVLQLQCALADRLVLDGIRARITGGRLRFFISGGAPLNQSDEEFFWLLGVKILQGWGLTETTSGASSNTESAHRYRTVGRPLAGVELRFDSDGEILVRGPIVMQGYFNKPEATAETIVDGWLRTGDIGVLDDEGFLTITDRKKDLIKTAGGKYVAPLPIEARLHADHRVQTALVYGDGRPYVVALIVPNWHVLSAEHGLDGEPSALIGDERVEAIFNSVVDSCNQELASFESVKRFALLNRDFTEADGELTPTLKPKRRVIIEHFHEEIERLYATPRSS